MAHPDPLQAKPATAVPALPAALAVAAEPGSQSPRSAVSPGRGVVMGLVAVAALTALKLAFFSTIGIPTPFLLYFSAVLLAAWYGGVGVGLMITLVTALLGAYLFIPPAFQFTFSNPKVLFQVGLFIFEGVTITLVTARLQLERRRAATAAQQARTALAQQRRQEESLRLSREWFSTALRSIGDAVITTDREGRVTFLNQVATELTGWTLAEAMGHPLREVFVIVSETTREPVESPVERVLREGAIVGLANHTILLPRHGPATAIDDSAAPIRSDSGAIDGVVLVFRDVSVKRREELRRSFQARATAEMNSSLDYQTTLATVARLAVPTIADWCAVDMLEAGTLQRLAVAHIDPAKLALVEELERRWPSDPNAATGVPNILRTGMPELVADIPPHVIDAAAIDEEHRTLVRQLALRSYMAVPIKRGPNTIGAITFAMAESQRLYGPEDLALAMALADRAAVAVENARLFGEVERANRAKDEFLAMLGHELRNPLAPILTALQLMQLRAGEVLVRERGIIERQVKHVVRLVDDLLDISRITRGKVELAQEPVAISEVVAKALEMASPLFEQRAHELSVAITPGMLVNGDPVRLAQVLANLLNNAAKYTEKGGHIWVRGESRDGVVLLAVRDNGMGITAQMLPRVFELFAQEPQALDRSQGGLGLGLAIVRSLVTLHGGTVTAQSDGLGKGSEFVIRLPALGGPAPSSTLSPPVVRPPLNPNGMRILVVDDNVDAMELLADSLELLGHQTVRATDGAAALILAAQQRPTIALLDIGLPIMNGYELARRLRETSGLSGIKLVALTGYGQQSDRDRSAAAGFDDHLVKPVTMQAVQAIITRLKTSP